MWSTTQNKKCLFLAANNVGYVEVQERKKTDGKVLIVTKKVEKGGTSE